MSYSVQRRQTEIGLRMALGADRGRVVRMIVGDAVKLLAIGLPLGAGLAVAGARSAETLLYGVQPWDPVTLAVATGALGVVALVASPALRASWLEPTTALRHE